jgi:regulator of RNase E activity RraB
MIAYNFVQAYRIGYGVTDADKKAKILVQCLDVCVDEAFRRNIRDLGLKNAVFAYYIEEYGDEFDDFWGGEREEVKTEIIALRNSFSENERTFYRGFSDEDTSYIERHKKWFLAVRSG